MFDVRSLEELRECTEYLNDKEGKCDIFIKNVGIIRDKTLGRCRGISGMRLLILIYLGSNIAQ